MWHNGRLEWRMLISTPIPDFPTRASSYSVWREWYPSQRCPSVCRDYFKDGGCLDEDASFEKREEEAKRRIDELIAKHEAIGNCEMCKPYEGYVVAETTAWLERMYALIAHIDAMPMAGLTHFTSGCHKIDGVIPPLHRLCRTNPPVWYPISVEVLVNHKLLHAVTAQHKWFRRGRRWESVRAVNSITEAMGEMEIAYPEMRDEVVKVVAKKIKAFAHAPQGERLKESLQQLLRCAARAHEIKGQVMDAFVEGMVMASKERLQADKKKEKADRDAKAAQLFTIRRASAGSVEMRIVSWVVNAKKFANMWCETEARQNSDFSAQLARSIAERLAVDPELWQLANKTFVHIPSVASALWDLLPDHPAYYRRGGNESISWVVRRRADAAPDDTNPFELVSVNSIAGAAAISTGVGGRVGENRGVRAGEGTVNKRSKRGDAKALGGGRGPAVGAESEGAERTKAEEVSVIVTRRNVGWWLTEGEEWSEGGSGESPGGTSNGASSDEDSDGLAGGLAGEASDGDSDEESDDDVDEDAAEAFGAFDEGCQSLNGFMREKEDPSVGCSADGEKGTNDQGSAEARPCSEGKELERGEGEGPMWGTDFPDVGFDGTGQQFLREQAPGREDSLNGEVEWRSDWESVGEPSFGWEFGPRGSERIGDPPEQNARCVNKGGGKKGGQQGKGSELASDLRSESEDDSSMDWLGTSPVRKFKLQSTGLGLLEGDAEGGDKEEVGSKRLRGGLRDEESREEKRRRLMEELAGFEDPDIDPEDLAGLKAAFVESVLAEKPAEARKTAVRTAPTEKNTTAEKDAKEAETPAPPKRKRADKPLKFGVKRPNLKKRKGDPPEPVTGWGGIDDNLLFTIVTRTDPRTTAVAAAVCKGWKEVCLSDELWAHHYRQRYGALPKEQPLKKGGQSKLPWYKALVQRTQAPKSAVICPDCGRPCAKRAELARHLKLAHTGGLQCELCSETTRFRSAKGLEWHMREKHPEAGGEKPPPRQEMQCGLCHARCKSQETLDKHVKLMHTERKKLEFVCGTPGCSFASRSQYALKRHCTNTQHAFPPPHLGCPRAGCDYRAYSQAEIRKHAYSHPSQCAECGEQYPAGYTRWGPHPEMPEIGICDACRCKAYRSANTTRPRMRAPSLENEDSA
ncbi:hypothetical protein KFL_001700020 [Klebsormidium nitens]|uniref:C2H2-type domain-containing protein n=1 Tax=Klebsormidium nitens TaxID=105231 RepID=A0A1Y1I5F1_KLENI|nr:hypothetical protein KFL_001700020 [Klebsormidium nitens]|eukprot:GAQ83947.1 hypothetical protein KFL_001700020 [Klebsormidium nitens]